MSQATGYAVKADGNLQVETVSPSRRGAMVHWLVVAHQVPITHAWTDENIFDYFQNYTFGAQVVSVDITESERLVF